MSVLRQKADVGMIGNGYAQKAETGQLRTLGNCSFAAMNIEEQTSAACQERNMALLLN